MKKLSLFIILILSYSLSFSQNSEGLSAFFRIQDQNARPLEGARITILNKGFQSKLVKDEGVAIFENLPDDIIKFIVEFKGFKNYEGEGRFSQRAENNFIIITLEKLDKETRTIQGIITDKKGNKKSNVSFRVLIDQDEISTLTDKFGRFSLKVNASDINVHNIEKIEYDVYSDKCPPQSGRLDIRRDKEGKISSIRELEIQLECTFKDYTSKRTPLFLRQEMLYAEVLLILSGAAELASKEFYSHYEQDYINNDESYIRSNDFRRAAIITGGSAVTYLITQLVIKALKKRKASNSIKTNFSSSQLSPVFGTTQNLYTNSPNFLAGVQLKF